MKTIISIFLVLFSLHISPVASVLAEDSWASLQSRMHVWNAENWTYDPSTVSERDFIQTAQTYFFTLLWVVCIWMLLWVGTRMFIADWDEEEFKKSKQALAYIIAGIVVTSVAFGIITLVTSLNI